LIEKKRKKIEKIKEKELGRIYIDLESDSHLKGTPASLIPQENEWMPFYYEKDIEDIDVNSGDAPPVPLSKEVLLKFIPFLELNENDVLLDLGCGDGRILIEAMKQSQCKKAIGIDELFHNIGRKVLNPNLNLFEEKKQYEEKLIQIEKNK